MTTIQDLLTYADGSKANGRLAVFWRPFTIGNANVTGGELAYDIVEGAVSVTLYPNAGALPSGSYYSAKYELENGAVYEEQWIVPNLPTVNLGQVRVSFPPTPSILISPTQLTSMNAQPGMFLMWDGARWVPGYPSTFNLDPNWIGINIGALGSDINVVGSPVSVGNYVTIHIPDADVAARGVVSIGAQTFAGAKTLKDVATISQSLIFAQHAIYAAGRGELVNIGGASAHALYFGGDIVAARVATTDRPRMQADRLVTGHIDIDAIADPPTAMMPGNATSPAKGTEAILLPPGSVDWAGIGMGVNGSLWLRTGGAFFYLNQSGATCRELRMDPYQHPNSVGIEAARNDATMVIYSDSTSWGGYGVNTTPELWFRMGPDNAGAYYYFGAGGATFPSLAVGTLVVSGAVTLPPDSGLVPTFQIDGGVIGTRPILNFVQGTNVSIQGVEDNTLNRVDIHISAAGGGDSGGLIDPTNAKGDLIVRGAPKPAIPTAIGVGSNGQVLTADSATATGIKWASALPANDTSTQRLRISQSATLVAARQELNLIPGANVTLTVVDNPGGNRVDATVAVGSIGALQTPWTSDIDAATHTLFNVGKIGVNVAAPLARLHVSGGAAGFAPNAGTQILASNSGGAAYFEAACAVAADGCGYLFSSGASLTSYIIDIASEWQFVSAAWPVRFYLGGVDRFHITTAGNVGIGVASPIGRLMITSTGTWTPTSTVGMANIALVTNGAFGGGVGMIDGSNMAGMWGYSGDWIFGNGVTSGALVERMRITAAGNVGIGTAAPSSALVVVGTVNTNTLYLTPGTVPGWDTATRIWFENGFGTRYDGYQHRFDVGGSRTEAMRITTAGNVGIGTVGPQVRFQVCGPGGAGSAAPPAAGTYGTGAVIISNDVPLYGMFIGSLNTGNGYIQQQRGDQAITYHLLLQPNGGNVGIGILAPTVPLQFANVLGSKIMLFDGYGFGVQSSTLEIFSGDQIKLGTGASGAMTARVTITGVGVRVGANGYSTAAGDLGVARDNSPSTGAVFFGNAGQVIYFDGGIFQFTAGITTAGSGYFTGAGRVGVGTGNPLSKVHIYGAGQDGSGGHYWPGLNPDCELYVQDSGGGGGNGGAVVFGSGYGVHAVMKGFVTNGAGPMGDLVWYLRPTTTDTALFEKMRLDSSGSLGVQGNINIIGQYRVNGVPISTGIAGMMVQINGGGANGPFTFLNYQAGLNMVLTGSVGGTGNNTFTLNIGSSSDARLKRNVQTLAGGLSLINQLRPIRAEWNGLANTREGGRVVSIIAQELQAVIPDAVAPFRAKLQPERSEETELLGFDPMAITAHLILAVQQLDRRLKVLEPGVN